MVKKQDEQAAARKQAEAYQSQPVYVLQQKRLMAWRQETVVRTGNALTIVAASVMVSWPTAQTLIWKQVSMKALMTDRTKALILTHRPLMVGV